MYTLGPPKTLRYDFHYKLIEKKYGNKAAELFIDVDLLCFEIEAEDVYGDFYADKDKFDN